MSAVNVLVTVGDPDLLIAGDSLYAAFAAAKIQLYSYASEALARANSSATLVTTFTLVSSDTAAADPDIAGPFRFGYYDGAQAAGTWYRYRFADVALSSFSPLSEAWQSDNQDQVALRDILFEVGELLGGSVQKGTASAGAANTVTCTKLFKSAKRDARLFEGWYLAVTQDAGGAGAAPEGEEALIDSVDASTGVATLDLALTVDPANGDIFLISAYLSVLEMIRIINRAREKMKVEALVEYAVTGTEDRYPAPFGVKTKADVVKAVGIIQYANSNREDEFEVDCRVVRDGLRTWVEFADAPRQTSIVRLTVLRSYRDIEGPLTLMTDTTSCPIEWWRPAFAFAIAEWLHASDENEPEYQKLLSDLSDDARTASLTYGPDISRPVKSGTGREALPGPAWCP